MSKPLYSFDQPVISHNEREALLNAAELTQVESLVFAQWGLRKIEPYARSALNLYGPPGTGKTLAAYAIAQRLNLNILVASYAEVESKFVGDGPKNIKALFIAAERNNAVLFIDEADSLLSRRLTHVTLVASTRDFSRRDIKNAIIDAAVQVARRKASHIGMDDLLNSIQ